MTIKVIGHRGQRQHPEIDENSAMAFEAALKHADGVETDAIVSKDGTVWLGHDTSQKYVPHVFSRSRYVFNGLLDEVSTVLVGKRRIDQMTDAEIDQLRLKKGAKVARLSELFNQAAQYPGKTINIEIKGDQVVEAILAEIDKAVAAGQVTRAHLILSSFNHPAIAQVRALAPDLKCGLIFAGSSDFNSRIFPWSGNKESRYVAFNKRALESKMVNDINPEFFVLRGAAVTSKNIRKLRNKFPAGKVMFWMSAEKLPEQNKQIVKILTNKQIAPVIEAVITDHPEQMAKFVKTLKV